MPAVVDEDRGMLDVAPAGDVEHALGGDDAFGGGWRGGDRQQCRARQQ